MSDTTGPPSSAQNAKAERAQVACLMCKQQTWHEVVAVVRGGDDDESGWYTSEQYQVIRCCGCDNLSFRQTYEDASWGPDDPLSEVLWPPRTEKRVALRGWHQLPKQITQVYRETNGALSSGQPVLAAVGIRALVEAVCKHKKAKGKNLQQRIDNLVVRGLLTKAQARVLHKTRFLGNKAAHEAKPVDEKVLESAMQVGEHMLTSVYLLPRIAKAMGPKK